MFNILLDELPKTVTIDGHEYAIRWGFRTMIKVDLVLSDEQYEMQERRTMALNMFYVGDGFTANVAEAERQMLAFYGSDKPRNRKQEAEAKRNFGKPPVYSYDYDDEYIYAAFRQQYGVNLNTVEGLHWFEFRAMLHSLNDCVFNTIKGHRGIDTAKIKNSDERHRLEELKELYALPDPRFDQQVVDEFEYILMNGGDISAFIHK